MKPSLQFLSLSVVFISIGVIAAVSWHSVEEIHYLKTFYPRQFTVEEVFYASGVELIKVFLIALPLFLLLGIGWGLLGYFKKEGA